ncbi:Importin N-terminal domain-containing protein [Heracleum sosnowskyi]|uniref:Importin N-terminal domain-containing protein n=1 Tax=Heracleum sosnowskyi TaxID=360622 RepID=A0AAD8M3U8_9APIA|nr:Importin N-terminal domain-containing protein [Heracleum sosnowskyi]
MAMDISQLLQSVQSAAAAERTGAKSKLRELEEQNSKCKLKETRFFEALMAQGCNLIQVNNEVMSIHSAKHEWSKVDSIISKTTVVKDIPNESRILAGIILKNSLHAEDAATKAYLVQQWAGTDINCKSQIKVLLLNTLRSSIHQTRHAASQALQKIASIEIPQKTWPDLVSLLVKMTEEKPATLKQATLETLGYVCEEISHKDLQEDEVNYILYDVVQGMRYEESVDVRLTATRALNNALNLAKTKFQNETDRNIIMNVLFETAIAEETIIRQSAFECFVSITSMYYDVPEPYIQEIFQLTAVAVQEDKIVGLQEIKFWSSICDEEIKLQNYKVPDTHVSEVPHPRFIEKALSYLIPV